MGEKKRNDAAGNYQAEINSFKDKFFAFKDKKIVLYGIGRYTAVLIPAIKEFHVIGLMDKDEDNIGKVMFGLPVISKKDAEQNADLVIINTSESYWRVIYKRIRDLSIPIYFLNGENAAEQVEDDSYRNNPYWQQNIEQLRKQISQYDVVSFDIFDTLILRKVFMPQDVFKLVEARVRSQIGLELDFYQIRQSVNLMCNDNHMLLDEIYSQMNEKWGLQENVLETIEQLEIETELECCVPRQDMVQLYNETVLAKEVYLISDMYLPAEVICKILSRCGVQKVQNIWISGEKKKNKKSGELWECFSREILNGRRALHIGDNLSSDIRMPRQYGIDSYYIMGSAAMWENSSLGNFVPKIQKFEQSIFAGMLGSRIFNSPFALSESSGMVLFAEFEQLGYCLWGGVIYSFLVWLVKEAKEREIGRLFFLARDGYLLERNYRYLQELWKEDEWPKAIYMAISRRMVLISSYENEGDLDNIINVPYNGTFGQYLEDRFGVQALGEDSHAGDIVSVPGNAEEIREWLKPYLEKILMVIQSEKENYLKYIQRYAISEKDGLIDLWFYGNNQYYLSKVVGKPLTGFYFAVNLNGKNSCGKNNILIPCFQQTDDLEAKDCNLKKGDIFVESFLTAPYGMIKSVDENGDYRCSAGGMNQTYFDARELINQGVCAFMREYTELAGRWAILSPQYMDDFFGEYIKEHLDLEPKLKKVFYYDNALIHRGESKVFE